MQPATWHDGGVDDRALIDAARAGDRDAFGRLVERESAAVYRTCLRILRRPADAEDVTQEAFVAAFRAIRAYRGEGSPRSWLMRIGSVRPTVASNNAARPPSWTRSAKRDWLIRRPTRRAS